GPFEILVRVRQLVIAWIRVTHPTPTRLRLHRHSPTVVIFSKRLQSGNVRCECKATIAYGQWRIRVNFADNGIVPSNERLAVYRRRTLSVGGQSPSEPKAKCRNKYQPAI